MKIENVKTNTVPSLTWNWLKSNYDVISFENEFTQYNPVIKNAAECEGVLIKDTCDVQKIIKADFGSGVFNKANKKVKDTRNIDGTTNEKEDVSKIQDYQNHPLQNLINNTVKTPQLFVIEKSVSQPLVLYFDFEKPCISSQIIYAKENTTSSIIMLFSGKSPATLLQTKVYAESYANIKIIKAQLLDNKALMLDDTQVFEEENANVHFSQIELGSQHVNSGLFVNLNGYKARFTSKVSYLCSKDQVLDMNHIVYHYGKKTECNMKVDGTIKDNGQKSYRGTIDLKKGCCGAKGNEMEETLLLSPTAINKSLPVILCDEEDVEGEHGATIGRLSSDILFYMQSRGISEKEAEVLISRAKIQSSIDDIQNDSVKEQISNFLDNIL